jgi:hypothetical protein
MTMIQAETIASIASLLNEQGVDESSVSQLRGQWPEIHFTYCSDDDIHSGRPVEEAKQFNIYLVDSREHCLALTSDLDIATGLVIAELVDEE